MNNFLIKIRENLTFFDRLIAAIFSFITFIFLDILLPNNDFSNFIILMALLHLTMPLATWGARSTLLGVISLLPPDEKKRVFLANITGVSLTSIFSFFLNASILLLALPIEPLLGLLFFFIGYFNSWVISELFLYNQGREAYVLWLRICLFIIFSLSRYFLYLYDSFSFIILSVPLEVAVRHVVLLSASSLSLKALDRHEVINFLKGNSWTAVSNTLSGNTYRIIVPLAGAMRFADMISLGYAQRFFDLFALLFGAAIQNISVQLSRASDRVAFIALLRRSMFFLCVSLSVIIFCVSLFFYLIELYSENNRFNTILLLSGIFAGGASAIIGIIGYLGARLRVERLRAEAAAISAGVMYVVVILGMIYWSPTIIYALLPIVSILMFVTLSCLVPRFTYLKKINSLFLDKYKRSP